MDPTYRGFSPSYKNNTYRQGPNFARIGIIAVIVLGVLITIGIVANMLGSGNGNDAQRLVYRIDALAALAKQADNRTSNEDLLKTSTELSLVLAGDSKALQGVLPAPKESKELTDIKNAENDKSIIDQLKSARTNHTFDATLRKALQDRLQASYQLAGAAANNASKSQRTVLSTIREHLQFYYKHLSSNQ